MTIAGYKDPKSGGDVWGTSELLKPAQINTIANNQRHFARAQWMGLEQLTQTHQLRDIATLTIDSSANTRRVYWIGANGTEDTANVLTSLSSIPLLSETAHSQTMTGVNGIYSVGARPSSRGWWGLESQAGSARGYLSWTGPGGTFAIHNRAGTSSGVKRANAIAYASDLNVLVAAWSDGWLEWNTTDTTWAGQSVSGEDISQVLYGNGHFVAMANVNVSTVYVSANGTSWTPVPLGFSMTGARLSYDAGDGRWYVCSTDTSESELTVLAAVAPLEQWTRVLNTTTPEEDGAVNAFVAHGGIWGLFSGGVLFVSIDLGQSWVAQSAAGSSNISGVKFAGGRLNAWSVGDGRHHYTLPFFPPYPSST